MALKWLIPLIIVMLFISACSIGNKTKPVVTNPGEEITDEATGAVVEEGSEEEPTQEEDIPEEPAEETEINETEEETKEELPPGTHIIIIKELKLDPQELTINKGDTVIWKHQDEWNDNTKHYLAAHTNEFRSPIFYYGDEFEHTFDKAGTFTYFDVIHKERDYMRGKIIVIE